MDVDGDLNWWMPRTLRTRLNKGVPCTADDMPMKKEEFKVREVASSAGLAVASVA